MIINQISKYCVDFILTFNHIGQKKDCLKISINLLRKPICLIVIFSSLKYQITIFTMKMLF